MKLSKNFRLSELLSSRVAMERNFTEQWQPSQEVIDNLIRLAENILQPLRDHYGKPITVNSGYRCKRLNEAVKGSVNSDHMKGMAADITGLNARELYDSATLLNLPFKQLIYYPDKNFVHISYDKKDVRKQKWINE
jgi:uncharacterized protein YcbK (DUF882 family)